MTVLDSYMRNLCGTFEGTIGRFPITMHIVAQYDDGFFIQSTLKSYFSGWYYYNSYKQPIRLSTDPNSEGDKIELSSENEKFILSFKNDTLNGEWISKEGNSLPVVAKLSRNLIQFQFHANYEPFEHIETYFKDPFKVGYSYVAGIIPKTSPNLKSINQIMSRIIDPINPGLDAKNALDNKEKSLRTWLSKIAKQDLKDLKKWCHEESCSLTEYVDNGCTNPNLYGEIYFCCCFLSKKICSIKRYERLCEGGSSYPQFYYYSIDLIHKKLFGINDIFIKEKLDEFSKVLPEFISSGDKELCDRDPKVKNNFFITENSITFCYNCYEIAPRSVGVILIDVPFYKIKKYLKRKFVKFLEAK